MVDYKSIFESLPGKFLVLEPESPYYIPAVSDELPALIERDMQQLIGKTITEFYRSNTSETTLIQLMHSIKQIEKEKKEGAPVIAKYQISSGAVTERFWSITNKSC